MSEPLQQQQIILMQPTHSGNIGAVARAMKTMGLSRLTCIAPHAPVDAQAITRAAGAADILEQMQTVDSLEEALAEQQLVFGLSARPRSLAWPGYSAREAAESVAQSHQAQRVAWLFGQERSGLTNEQLQHCHYHVTIPSDPDYGSLNLAAAVQVICYELRMALADSAPKVVAEDEALASGDMLQGFYQHLQQVLTQMDFSTEAKYPALMSKIQRLYNRAQPTAVEINILRGILASTQKHLGKG